MDFFSLLCRLVTYKFKSLQCLFLTAIVLFSSLIHSPFAVSASVKYQLGSGDRIQIQVYGEEDLSFPDVLISNTGVFDYPYIGQINALNKTTEQLKDEIYTGLKNGYLVEPKVMVSILSFRQVYINGEVRKPGGYEYQPGLTVNKAIALAGGFTDRASKSGITRSNSVTGKEGGKVSLDVKLQPGDIITVDESFF